MNPWRKHQFLRLTEVGERKDRKRLESAGYPGRDVTGLLENRFPAAVVKGGRSVVCPNWRRRCPGLGLTQLAWRLWEESEGCNNGCL